MSEKIYSRIFEAEEEIVHIGDPGQNAYYIERGRVQVTIPKGKGIEVLATLGKGEIFGEMSIIDDAPRSATVSALEKTEVFVIELSHHLNSLATNNPMMNLLLRVVLSRLRDANQQIAGSLSPKVSEEAPSTADIRKMAIERLALEREMKKGLDNDEFEIHYQPIISIQDGLIAGFEALMRWRNGNKLVSPDKFIPIAEETGLIIQQGRFALKQALRDHATFASALKGRHTFISVNLSGRQITNGEEIFQIGDIIRDSKIDPSQIKLEVTETLMLNDFEGAKHALLELKKLGVSIAIDDFGTGYSSLSYLHQLPLDTLKIDRAFVNDMQKTEKSMRIVESIVSLSKTLDMNIVAEGIEEASQINALKDIGCQYGQGYLISRPLPAKDLLGFIENPQL